MIIGFVVKLIGRSLTRQRVDPTLGRYVASTINVVLNIVLVIAILNVFGVETTSFAALLAAAGVAIGLAWSGLLGNFAAGAFLVFNLAGPVLAVRPYCHNPHYWQVYFDTNRVIRESFGEAGYPVPEQHYRVRTAEAGGA